MNTIIDFVNAAPWLSFVIVLALWGLTSSSLMTIRRIIRMCNISFRGWTPEHLDADGDFRPEPKKETPK